MVRVETQEARQTRLFMGSATSRAERSGDTPADIEKECKVAKAWELCDPEEVSYVTSFQAMENRVRLTYAMLAACTSLALEETLYRKGLWYTIAGLTGAATLTDVKKGDEVR